MLNNYFINTIITKALNFENVISFFEVPLRSCYKYIIIYISVK